MLELGTQFELTISEISFGGDGLGRSESGAVVFVPFSAMGDKLLVEITQVRKSYFRARIVEILEPSADRVQPECIHFGRCGGCAYQHLSSQAEFAAKQKQLYDLLQRVGSFTTLPALTHAFPAPQLYGYRNKLNLEPSEALRDDHGVHLSYGYCLKDEHRFFTVRECPLAMPIINQNLSKALRSAWAKQNAKKETPGSITLRASADGKCHYFFGRAPVNVPWLKEQIHAKEISVPLGSFWQVNSAVADKLFKTLEGWGRELTEVDTLVDAYSGVGTFSIALRAPYRERVLIESDPQACKAAAYNLARRNLGCRIIEQKTEIALPKILKTLPSKNTLLLLDPPRTGCQEKALQAILKFMPQQIFYISCNPATLARDLKKLCANGKYKIQKLALFDMFPRTAHFETAVQLQKT